MQINIYNICPEYEFQYEQKKSMLSSGTIVRWLMNKRERAAN